MKTTANDLRLIKEEKLPVGTFSGKWSGYEVTFSDGLGRTFSARTEAGVRGLNVPCDVIVHRGGRIDVFAKDGA